MNRLFLNYLQTVSGRPELVENVDVIAEKISSQLEGKELNHLSERAGQTAFFQAGKDIAHFEYVSPRERELTALEVQVRDVAYALKKANPTAVKYAAQSMSAHVPSGAVLVPIPSSQGDTSANLILAKEIAKLSGAVVVDALYRPNKVMQSHQMRKMGLPIPQNHHTFGVKPEYGEIMPQMTARGRVFMVDNVITSGLTMKAGREALGNGARGLAFAKAKP